MMAGETPADGGIAAETGGNGAALKSAAEIALERAATASEKGTGAGEMAVGRKEMDELRAKAAKAQENWDRFVRATADLDNYRKRVARERQDLLQTANEKLLRDLLPALDHFEMGLQTVAGQTGSLESLREGMQIVFGQFQQFLKSNGVEEIEAVGKAFDPALHEAVAYQEAVAPEGQVVQQTRKGYRMNSRILRAATVVVSKGMPAPAAESPVEQPAETPVP